MAKTLLLNKLFDKLCDHTNIKQVIEDLRRNGELNEINAQRYKSYSSQKLWVFAAIPFLAYLIPETFPFRDPLLLLAIIGVVYYWEAIFLERHKRRFVLYTVGKKTQGTINEIDLQRKFDIIHYTFTLQNHTIKASERLPKNSIPTKQDMIEVLYFPDKPDKVNCLYVRELEPEYNLKKTHQSKVLSSPSTLFYNFKILMFIIVIPPCIFLTFSLMIYPERTVLLSKKYLPTLLNLSEKSKYKAQMEWDLNTGIHYLHAHIKIDTPTEVLRKRTEGVKIILEYGVDGANALATAIFEDKPIKFLKSHSKKYYSVNITAAKSAIFLIIDRMESQSLSTLKDRLLKKRNSPQLSEASRSIIRSTLARIKIQKKE